MRVHRTVDMSTGMSTRRRSYAEAASKAETSSDSRYSECESLGKSSGESSGKTIMKRSYAQVASHAPHVQGNLEPIGIISQMGFSFTHALREGVTFLSLNVQFLSHFTTVELTFRHLATTSLLFFRSRSALSHHFCCNGSRPPLFVPK